MLPEVVEVDGLPALKLHMYKQDTLTGYMELETDLSIRKADMWTSLILGAPSAMLAHKKLHEVLHVDKNSRWEDMMGIEEQTGGLTRVTRGVVTAPCSFIADHGDGGTVRVTLQGVSKSEGLGTKNRIEATLHVDVNYHQVSPHVVFEILGLDDDDDGRQMGAKNEHLTQGIALSRQRSVSVARERQRPGCGGDPAARGAGNRRTSATNGGEKRSSTDRQKHMSSGSKTNSALGREQKALQEGLMAKDRPHQLPGLPEEEGEGGAFDQESSISRDSMGEADLFGDGDIIGLGGGGEKGEGDEHGLLRSATQFGGLLMQVADMPDEAAEIEAQEEAKAKSSKAGRKPDEASKPGDDGQSESSAGDGGTDIDGQSMASGSSAHDEILVDFRRGRLLKKLILLIRGPSLMVPLNRFTKHSMLNILAIVAVHVIFFAIFMTLTETRAGQLYTIFRHGQAIDRSQIVYYRALRTEHCLKLAADGVTMPEFNICAKADNDPDLVMEDLQDAVEDYSSFHHDVFLGADGEVETIIDPTARSLWNDDAVKVRLYYDTDPPSEREVEKGLWEVGNRLAYAGRDLQVAYTQEPTSIGDSRAFYYVRENTPGAIFQNYIHSIDLISRFIHDDQGALSNAIIAFLVVEAVVILTLLHLYQLYLTVSVERARLGGVLAMVGLPIPVLKLMHKKPLMALAAARRRKEQPDRTRNTMRAWAWERTAALRFHQHSGPGIANQQT
ncbi:hypothetical protein DUNSADRAFT_852 [Dunaliella salina]|nr:hypothetical protein DUNSADRAFT_852 [Dunaliella salina]|eukprot:KAF5827326.1 hypothetical protein DUNSADRAFT_852 [Dunaliella salina]